MRMNLENKEFILSLENLDNLELEGKCKVWDDQSSVLTVEFANEKILEEYPELLAKILDKIEVKIKWLAKNKQEIVNFIMTEGILDSLNVWIEEELTKGKQGAQYHEQILAQPVSEEEFRDALYAAYLSFWISEDEEITYMMDLDSEPEAYLGGHLLNLEFDEEDQIDFGGMNG